MRITGVCRGHPDYTIWSHCRHGAAGKGGAKKSLDLAGAYCCTACDAAYDQMIGVGRMTREEVDADWNMGHFRSLVRLNEKGLLK